MRIAGDHDVIVDGIRVEGVESAITVRQVTIPCIVVEREVIARRDGLVDTGKDCEALVSQRESILEEKAEHKPGQRLTNLAANYTPRCAASLGLNELVVEPVFLAIAHQAATGLIGYLLNVFRIPVKIRDRPIILSGI